MNQKKTKIVCTLGPANSDLEKIKSLIMAGMNIARLNFSHGTHAEHADTIANLRKAADQVGQRIAILQDLSGPKLRLGRFVEKTVTVHRGANITLTAETLIGDTKIVSVNSPELIAALKPNDRVLIGDGIVEFQVLSTANSTAYCRVVVGGVVGSNQGVSAPGVDIKLPVPTQKDFDDLAFGLEHGVDMVAQSFVRTADEVQKLRQAICGHHCEVKIIIKLEKSEAIENLDAIIDAADGVMVARGDLGLEVGLSEVPYVQKEIIRKAIIAGKPVITATQMLESMIQNPRPTRAEASDVANAVFDGTDAVMLSGETAVGKYPVESCEMIATLAEAAEAHINYVERYRNVKFKRGENIPEAIANATCQMALALDAAVIICCTRSGQTARLISRYRPKAPIAVMSPNEDTLRQSLVLWGAVPVKIDMAKDTDTLIAVAKEAVLAAGLAKKGDTAIIVAGVPVSKPGTTNMVKAEIL